MPIDVANMDNSTVISKSIHVIAKFTFPQTTNKLAVRKPHEGIMDRRHHRGNIDCNAEQREQHLAENDP